MLAVLAWCALLGAGSALAASSSATDWVTYGNSLGRVGANTRERALGPTEAVSLKRAWRTDLAGAVNTQPLLVHDVLRKNRKRDVVYVGTEDGDVVALDAGKGRVLWRRQVGTRSSVPACQVSPDGKVGVNTTFTADRKAKRLYAVDADNKAYAFALGTGKTVRGWPVKLGGSRAADLVWGALALSRGRLYVPVASICDLGNYRGGVVGIRVSAPVKQRRWDTVKGKGLYAGGIWTWGGVAVNRRNGDVYVSTGNSLGSANEAEGYSERVVSLTSDLRVKQSNAPLRGPFTAGDRDFGSTPVLFRAAGCPAQLVALNKSGQLFLYDSDSLSSGPRQSLAVASQASGGRIPLIGAPAWDPASRTLLLASPSDSPDGKLHAGLQALRLGADCRFGVLWQRPFDPSSSALALTVARGVVYITSGRTGWLRAFKVSDGTPLWSNRLSPSGAFAAATVVDARVYAADWDGGVWSFAPKP